MEAVHLMIGGFQAAFSWLNLLYLFIGVLFGNLVGVLPGLGPVSGTVLLIPLTFKLPAATAIIMLSGVYYGAMYGGSTTSILLNIPGESSSLMTAVEGYQLTKQGRGGAALGMSAITSFIGGTLAVVGLMTLSPLMADVALSFGPPENFALIFAAFTIIASLGGSSVLKGLAMGALGVVFATIGIEPMVAQNRLTFGLAPLSGGVSFVAAAMGLFALPEVFEGIEQPGQVVFQKVALKLRNLMPNRQDFKDSKTAIPMGALTGFIGGVLPGAGATISSFFAYGIQKRIAKRPELFGKGSMEAIAAVEGANNAASTSALIPMLTFGIPGSGTAAILMGAMIIHGLQPGPLLFENNPDVVWALIASMYLGNIMLFILNLPLIGIWVSFMRLPTHIILTGVLAISVTGVYADENSLGDVIVMFGFGILGYILKKTDFPPAPIVLALVLTEQLEGALHRSLVISGGDWSIFFTRPLSLGLLLLALISIILQMPAFERWVGKIRRLAREEVGG
ncbi:MAG: tripartite tricarboxylate transporter permease [Thermodesulfobacteriota bacterium]